MSTQTQLGAALRAKFRSPAEVLKRLGLDADVLAPGGGKGDPAMKELRVALENLIGELHLPEGAVKKILALLDEHVDLGALPDSDPHAERVHAINGDDTDDEAIAKVRAFLKERLSADDADKAIALAMSEGRDGMLPLNATRGGGGAGRLTGDRSGLALDGFNRAFPELARITVEPPLHSRSRARPISAAGRSGYDEMFPDAGRIGVGSA